MKYQPPADLASALVEIQNRIWKTRSVRFAAERRLQSTQRASSFGMAVASAYTVLAPLALAVPSLEVSQAEAAIVGFALLTASTYILVVSVLDSAANRLVTAERLHLCATRLAELYDQTLAMQAPSKSRFEGVVAQYHRIIAECAANHDEIDSQYVGVASAVDGSATLPKWASRAAVRLKWGYGDAAPFYIFVLLLPIVTFIAQIAVAS